MSKQHEVVADISEERILQISNDVAEDMASGTKPELRAVIRYFQNEMHKEVLRRNQIHDAAMRLACDLLNLRNH